MLLISPTIMLDNFPIMLNKSPILLNKSPIMLLSHTYTTQVQKFPLKPSKQLLSLAKSSYFRQWWDDALYLAEPPFRLSRRLKKHNNIASNNSCLTWDMYFILFVEMHLISFILASEQFSISNLYPFQLWAVSTTVSGRDSLVIQPTRKGKSLCYQPVALQQNKLVFVFVQPWHSCPLYNTYYKHPQGLITKLL